MRQRVPMSFLRACVTTVMVAFAVLCTVSARASSFTDPFYRSAPAAPDLFLSPQSTADADALAHFACGYLLDLEGKGGSGQASAQYLSALRLCPDSSAILERLIGPWLIQREYEKITRVLGPLGETHPEAVNLQLVISEALAAQKKVPQAVALIEKALDARDWGEPLLFRQLFVYYWQQKEFPKIEELIARARRHVAMRDRFVVLHAAAAYWNARSHSPELRGKPRRRRSFGRRALRWARRAAANAGDANRAEDIVTLARLFLERGETREAEILLRQGLKTFGPGASRIVLLLASVLIRDGKAEMAVGFLDPFLSRPVVAPEVCVELGRLYIEAKRPEKAAIAYEKALFLRPSLSRLRIMLGYVYLHMDRAPKCLEVIKDLGKPAPEVHLLRSHAWYESGELKKAARELALAEDAARKVKNEHFFGVDYYLFYATLCEDMGLTDRALEEAGEALKLRPSDPVCLNFVGYVMADHGRELEKAEHLVRRALAAEPNNVAYLDSLAWTLFRRKRFRRALEVMNRCLRLGGDEADAIILDHAGDIYAANGFQLLSRSLWWKALESAPEKKDATRIRGKMQRAVADSDGSE